MARYFGEGSATAGGSERMRMEFQSLEFPGMGFYIVRTAVRTVVEAGPGMVFVSWSEVWEQERKVTFDILKMRITAVEMKCL